MKMKVTYDKGNTVTYKVKPRHLVRFEDEVGEFAETARSAYTLAWMASGSKLEFKDWLDTVDDIETLGADGKPADGVPPAEGGEAGEPVPTE